MSGRDATCNWRGCDVHWDDVGCPECGKHGYGFDAESLVEEVRELREAVQALSRELEHWIGHATGTAMRPQREKGEDVLRMARALLPHTQEADDGEG